ncbi:hypothetical protein [Hymenobacter bucti]|uniref:Uncharacterized protein n=1 Tax=Hymenobacter bucti TaxID=1844114 RepID=A0ABW4R1T5_9BACT
MRTYRKRVPQVRYCVHCGDAFESAHKRRIYCGNSCSTLAYYARKAQANPPATATATRPPALSTPAATTAMGAAAPPSVTLALNAQNLALFTAGPLLADGLKQVAQFVGQLLAPTPHAAPLTWLPAVFRLAKEPLVPFQHVDWEEPRFFVPVQWGGTVFYYRAAQDLLFWQDLEGPCYQLTKQAEFERILSQLRLQKQLPQRGLSNPLPPLTRELPRLPPQPKNMG